MAYSVRLMPRAAQDAEEIYQRIAAAAPVAGQDWFNRLIDSLDSLSDLPERCNVVRSLSKPGQYPIRRLLFGRKPHVYRIYFDVVDTTVRILHIRHGARREPAPQDMFGYPD
jgi:toxin ParE1/3/4